MPVIFYEQIVCFFDQYFVAGEAEGITINVGLEYFNTSSLKCIFQILRRIKDGCREKPRDRWRSIGFTRKDDEDMLETGEDIAALLDLDFNYYSDSVGIS